MATITHDLGWIDVSARIEPRALAGGIAAYASERVAEALVYAVRACEEEGHDLNDLQHQTLVEGLLRCWDGLEGSVLDMLLDAFKVEGDDAR